MKTIEVRPEKVWWSVVGISIFFSLVSVLPLVVWLFWDAKRPPQKEEASFAFVAIFALLSSAATTVGTIWMVRTRLVADEEGVRWLGTFGPWQSARWDEITDFYLLSSFENGRKIIEIGAKRLSLSPVNASAQIVAGMVAERASKAPFRAWQMRGTRPGETFYAERRAWSPLWWVWGGVSLVLVLSSLFCMASFNIWLLKEGPFVLLSLPIGLLMLAVFARRLIQRKERLEINERGLLLVNGHRGVFIAWDKLEVIQKRWRRYTVRFAGGEIVMGSWFPTTFIEKMGRALAPTARFESDTFGSTRSVTSEGVCLSHPRSVLFMASFFSLLIGIAGVSCVGIALLLPADFLGPRPAPRLAGLLPFLLFAIPIGYSWLVYWRCAVTFREDGLEVHGVWRSQFFAWKDVEFWRDANGLHLRANGRKLGLLNDWRVPGKDIERELRVYLPERGEAS